MVERFLPPSPASSPPTDSGSSGDPPLDLDGVSGAVRRGARAILGVAVLVAVVVLAVSLLADPRYRTTARIAEEPAAAEEFDVAAADRRLATSRELVTSPAVLATASGRLPSESAASLAGKVTARVDANASMLDVEATAGDPALAARIANAVATTFVAERERSQQAELRRSRERLTAELERQTVAGAAATTLEALRQRIIDLTVSEATTGAGLRVVEPAAVPSDPYAPRPLRSAFLAFVAALLCGVLVALAHDRRRIQPPDAAGLSRIAHLPLIAALPSAAGRREGWPVDQALIEETALQAAVRGALSPDDQHVIVVHGLGSGDDVARVGAGLVRSLSWAGYPAVLVELADPDDAPEDAAQTVHDVPVVRCSDREDELEELRRSRHRYLVVLGPEVSQSHRLRMLGGESTAALLVARLGRATATDAARARRLIGALGLHGLGLVVTCTAREARAMGPDDFAPALPAPTRWRRAARNGDGPHRLDVSITRERR